METKDKSVEEFKDFLNSLVSLNIVRDATARNLRNSSFRLLTVVREEESSDVTTLDINALAERYERETEPTPTFSSMTAYKSRMASAIQKFVSYLAGESMSISGKDNKDFDENEFLMDINREEKKLNDNVKLPPPPRRQRPSAINDSSQGGDNSKNFESIDVPIPLRPGMILTIPGIPTDLTNEEAERIASILKVYARPK